MMEFFEYVKQQADRRQTYGELRLKNHIPNIPSVAISNATAIRIGTMVVGHFMFAREALGP